MLKGTAREAAAEFFGTFILIVFGTAVVAQVVLSKNLNGEYLSINLGWGLAVTMAIYACGGVTGAHINPAVTVALAVHRQFPWSKVLPYIVAQVAGAFVASIVTYAVYYDALNAFDSGVRAVPSLGENATAGIWATYPAAHLKNVMVGGLIDQIVGTALLVGLVFAITDTRNMAPGSNLAPVMVGALVLLIGMTFGFNAGYAINPARDFGPRLFTAVAGWGSAVFTVHGGMWWWVPIVGPLAGGVLGGFVYDFFVGWHLPPEGSTANRPDES